MLVRMRGQLWAMGVLMALAALSWAQPASAAAPPVSIAGIEVKNNALVGLITASGGATIDPALTVTISGKDYPVDAITSGQGTPVARSAIIVVDTSGSMGAPGMATVRASVAAFLKSVPDDVHVGVIAFSGTARLIVAPS